MSDTQQPKQAPTTNNDPSKRGVKVVLVLIVLSLGWYLLADRFTPYTQQARVQAYVVPVAAEVAGQVIRVDVQNNQVVSLGQELFALDPTQYQIAVERAQADLDSTKRQVSASTAGIDAALANVRAAQANQLKARQDRERLELLYREDSGTISLRRLEVSRATLEQASSQVVAAEAEVQRAREQEGGSGEDNANLRSANSALTKAELDLAKTRVTARSAGLVTDLRTEVGQFAGAGSPVLTLIAIQDVWINADMSENNLGHLKPGSPVKIILDSRPGSIFAGRVRSIGYGVSVSQPTPPGSLPTIQNSRDWLRAAQRFPVVVEFLPGELDDPSIIRVGGQAEVMAFPSEGNPLNLLGSAFMRLMSWLSYAY